MTPDTSHSARIAQILTIAGAIPFIICALVLAFGNATGIGQYRPLALQSLTTYAAVIISFLGGIQWGIGIATLEQQPQTARSLFLLSVVPSLLAWAMLFLPASESRVVVALFLVAFVWVIDALLYLQKVIPPWFFRLRSITSAVVMVTLLIALVAI
jgi:Protein of unknown function (DUF3429)